MSSRSFLKSIALSAAVVLAPLAPSRAETRAVVVGIDTYKTIVSLRGAEADARDIGGALRKREIHLLVNRSVDQTIQHREYGGEGTAYAQDQTNSQTPVQ